MTVLSLPDKQRRTLHVTTQSASAWDAHQAALEVIRDWPPGSRVLEVAPLGDDLWLTNDPPATSASE